MNHKALMDLRSRIGDHLMSADDHAEQYLRACGWTRTCKTPGCVWMWVRNMPAVLGSALTQVSFYRAKDALEMQDRISAQLHPLDMAAQSAQAGE